MKAEQDEDWTSGPRRPVAKKRAQASVTPSAAPGLSTMQEEDDPAAFTWIQVDQAPVNGIPPPRGDSGKAPHSSSPP